MLLYSKPRCGLCDKARDALEEAGIEFLEIDITKDAALKEEYGLLIPVVLVDGRLVFEAGMNPKELPGLVEESRNG